MKTIIALLLLIPMAVKADDVESCAHTYPIDLTRFGCGVVYALGAMMFRDDVGIGQRICYQDELAKTFGLVTPAEDIQFIQIRGLHRKAAEHCGIGGSLEDEQ